MFDFIFWGERARRERDINDALAQGRAEGARVEYLLHLGSPVGRALALYDRYLWVLADVGAIRSAAGSRGENLPPYKTADLAWCLGEDPDEGKFPAAVGRLYASGLIDMDRCSYDLSVTEYGMSVALEDLRGRPLRRDTFPLSPPKVLRKLRQGWGRDATVEGLYAAIGEDDRARLLWLAGERKDVGLYALNHRFRNEDGRSDWDEWADNMEALGLLQTCTPRPNRLVRLLGYGRYPEPRVRLSEEMARALRDGSTAGFPSPQPWRAR